MNKMKLYRQYKKLDQYPMKRSEKALSFTFVNFAKNKHIFGIEAAEKDFTDIHNIIDFSICEQATFQTDQLLAIIKKCHQRNGHISSINLGRGLLPLNKA